MATDPLAPISPIVLDDMGLGSNPFALPGISQSVWDRMFPEDQAGYIADLVTGGGGGGKSHKGGDFTSGARLDPGQVTSGGGSAGGAPPVSMAPGAADEALDTSLDFSGVDESKLDPGQQGQVEKIKGRAYAKETASKAARVASNLTQLAAEPKSPHGFKYIWSEFGKGFAEALTRGGKIRNEHFSNFYNNGPQEAKVPVAPFGEAESAVLGGGFSVTGADAGIPQSIVAGKYASEDPVTVHSILQEANDAIGRGGSDDIIRRAYGKAGINIGSDLSDFQLARGKRVPLNQARVGDLVGWTERPGHVGQSVGIALSNGLVIKAPAFGEGGEAHVYDVHNLPGAYAVRVPHPSPGARLAPEAARGAIHGVNKILSGLFSDVSPRSSSSARSSGGSSGGGSNQSHSQTIRSSGGIHAVSRGTKGGTGGGGSSAIADRHISESHSRTSSSRSAPAHRGPARPSARSRPKPKAKPAARSRSRSRSSARRR